jgi:hypothetical protein
VWGYPYPPKVPASSVPAMKTQEIQRLAVVDPDLYALAIEMERRYRGGKHFRGDDVWTVKAKHKETGEVEQFECEAPSAQVARSLFRYAFNDVERPYRYKLSASQAVPGLGRNFKWQDVDLVELKVT